MTTTSEILALTPVLVNGTVDIVTLPLSSTYPWYNFTINLGGVQFTLHFRYNVRMLRWVMDIADAQDNLIISSIPLLINVNLIGRFAQATLPYGVMWVVDNTGQNTQPTQFSFGTTHSLLFYDPLGLT